MTQKINKFRVMSNLFWKYLEMGGTQGIQFIVQLVLARLLFPEDYGIVAIIAIFVQIAQVFVQSGFSSALIQKKIVDEKDLSSVFYLTFFIAGIIYLLLFFTSPFISNFFEEPVLEPAIRVLAIILFFGAFKSVQIAIVARNLYFKKLFFSSLGAIIISGSIGIAMAFMGYGVWALIAQQLTNRFVAVVILFITLRWRPRLLFSIKRIKSLFTFGSKLLASSLLENSFLHLRSIIIGKVYSSAALGFYNNGKFIPHVLTQNINGSIQSVLFPVLSSKQDNRRSIKLIVRRSIVTSSFLMFPMMIGLASVSDSFIEVVLTEKWLPAAPYLRIFCLSYALYPIHTANLQAIKAIGRSDVFLKLEVIKKILTIIILIITVFHGVYAIALGVLISSIMSTFINAYPNNRLLNYKYREQIVDILPALMLSILMGLVVYIIHYFIMNIFLLLSIQILAGIIIYIGMAKLLKMESLDYIINSIKEIYYKRRNRHQ